ncbi:hypothetical protein [Sphingomonas sp. CFBP 8760]|uniref:hypothetical protein n=1 Tax=Sphingomonas sp. CFBP 8760 TaxID=2775282 RepID=UPI00177E08A8|nr:hypothetical protein [Sphingomonas sp. CFBP 8760]MBD8548851.1 hypothetical protein [Sphingomonas sp. CFBP 8760]
MSYDTSNDILSLDVPVYIARDDAGQLRGGLRAIYTDRPDPTGGRTDDLSIGIFIGVPFSIFGS